MKIEVTKEDIEKGKRQDPKNCPIGHAVSRSGIPHLCITDAAVIVANERHLTTALLLPEAVQHWICEFDRNRPVEPMSFEVGLPVPVACPGELEVNGSGARHRNVLVRLACAARISRSQKKSL